jgi:phosphotransferase system enzyme I (PtsI)
VTETRLSGRAAAPGIAAGPVHRLHATAAPPRHAGTPAEEAAALAAALATALDATQALAARAGGEAAEMLAFQAALIEDPALAEPAFAAIAAGTPAEAAWAASLAAEMALYRDSGDALLAGRAADLADLRDRVLAALHGEAPPAPPPPGALLAAADLGPAAFLAADWSAGGGVLLAEGSPGAHVAMLARARGVPMVTGLGALPEDGAPALLDGAAGLVVVHPAPATAAAFAQRAAALADAEAAAARLLHRPAATADGTPVRVLVNLGDPAELAGLDPALCDGVGLVRTEFLFAGAALPDEATQLAAYRRILAWAAGRPVAFRTLDAGGDKPIPGLTPEDEANPFLGLRGLRLSLARPAAFRVQLRALARAAAEGPARIMLPMVTLPAELATAAALLAEEAAAAGVPAPPLGIMVEVPAAALGAARFPAAFYSIGSNDLVQYVMAAARDNGAVAGLQDAADPAVLELLARVAAVGAARGVEVSLCGDAAADPALVPALLDAGLRALSVAPRAVGLVKAAIAAHRL